MTVGPSAKTGAEWRWWPEDPPPLSAAWSNLLLPQGLPSEPTVTQQNPCVSLALKDPLRLFPLPPYPMSSPVVVAVVSLPWGIKADGVAVLA